MVRRLLGVIILLISLVIIAICIAGAYYIGPTLDSVGDSLDSTLGLSEDALNNVSATLEQTKSTIVTVNEGIATADQTSADLSKTIADTIPLIEGINVIVTSQAPENIENIQAAIPDMAEVAGVVDTTLTTLSNFGLDESFDIPLPFGRDIKIPLQFDLGIEYEPTVPFDETVLSLGTGLDGLPEQMRTLEGDLDLATENLQVVSDDILQASKDLEAANQEIALFIPLLDEYLRIMDEIIDTVGQIRVQYNAQVETIKTGGMVLFIFMALTQLAPLVFGWDLMTGRGNDKKDDDQSEPDEQPAAVAEADEPQTEVGAATPIVTEAPVEKVAPAEEVEELKTNDVEEVATAPENPQPEPVERVQDETIVEPPPEDATQVDAPLEDSPPT